MVLEFPSMNGLFLREKDFVQLLAGPDADHFPFCAGGDRLGQIRHAHARNLRHENLAAEHEIRAAQDETRGLFLRNPKPGHALIGDRERAPFRLLPEYRDHAAPWMSTSTPFRAR